MRDNSLDVLVSASFHRGGWEVRWRDASGRRRARRFPSEEAARAFDDALAEVSPAARRADTARHGRGGGVYSYRTGDGARWRFVYRRSDGTQTTKRGFASERAASDARRRLIEQVERGEVRHTRETFGGYWQRWLARRRPYLETGTWTGYEIAGRKRLVPAFGALPLGELSVNAIREFVAELAEDVETGAGSEDREQCARDPRRLSQLGGRRRLARGQPRDSSPAVAARPHRAGLPAARRDPAIPRWLLRDLSPTR